MITLAGKPSKNVGLKEKRRHDRCFESCREASDATCSRTVVRENFERFQNVEPISEYCSTGFAVCQILYSVEGSGHFDVLRGDPAGVVGHQGEADTVVANVDVRMVTGCFGVVRN